DAGGRAVVVGRLGENLPGELRERIAGHPRSVGAAHPEDVLAALPDGPQVTAPAGLDVAIGLHRVAGGSAVHLLRYDYDERADGVPPLAALELRVRLPEGLARCRAVTPGGEIPATVSG